MQNIVEEGRRFASIADLKVSDMSSQSPVGTTLAILERTLKVMSSVQARVHAAMKQEFKILAKIIRDDTPTSYAYDPASGEPQVKQADYDMVEVVPVSNPNSSTMAQRVVQYQTVMQLAQGSPQIYDMPELHRQMLETIGIENVGKIIPSEDEQKPQAPVFENMNLLNGKPVKAFMYQDHESHIKVHMNAKQDPYIQDILKNNPAAPGMDAAAQAHIAEHVAFLYRAKLEEQLGVTLPSTEEKLPEGIEVQLSKLVAEASDQLLQQNQQRAAQEQALEKAQDPVVQMQQAELELKYADLERKSNKDKTDAELKGAQVGLDAARIQSEEKKAMAKLLAEAVKDDEEHRVKQVIEGAKLGADAAKNANGKVPNQ